MENTLAVAKALSTMHKEMFDKSIDEMKMHKLMYFAQRESLIVNDDVLFDEEFCGWRYGPVLLSVRDEFLRGTFFQDVKENVSAETRQLLRAVLDRFGNISSWNLSVMSHEEISWKLSRVGLGPADNGSAHLSIDAMRIDAAREAASRNVARAAAV